MLIWPKCYLIHEQTESHCTIRPSWGGRQHQGKHQIAFQNMKELHFPYLDGVALSCHVCPSLLTSTGGDLTALLSTCERNGRNCERRKEIRFGIRNRNIDICSEWTLLKKSCFSYFLLYSFNWMNKMNWTRTSQAWLKSFVGFSVSLTHSWLFGVMVSMPHLWSVDSGFKPYKIFFKITLFFIV